MTIKLQDIYGLAKIDILPNYTVNADPDTLVMRTATGEANALSFNATDNNVALKIKGDAIMSVGADTDEVVIGRASNTKLTVPGLINMTPDPTQTYDYVLQASAAGDIVASLVPSVDRTFLVDQAAGSVLDVTFETENGTPITVDWGDGSAPETVGSGAAVQHTYTAAYNGNIKVTTRGTKVVKLEGRGAGTKFVGRLKDISAGLTDLILGSTSSTITGALSDLPASATFLRLNNTPSVITGDLADLPASATVLRLHNTSSTITGDLSDLPASALMLYLGSTPSVITGALSDLPASMTTLHLNDTSSTLTGDLADLPASMTYVLLFNTSSVITGDLSDLPAGMTQLALNRSTTITGALADLPAGMKGLNLPNTPSTITGALADLPASMTYDSTLYKHAL